jgi:hypothetical protein
MRRDENAAIIAAYATQGVEACSGKGGFFLVGRGFVALAQARKESGINMAQKRAARMVTPVWGDAAIVRMLNTRG